MGILWTWCKWRSENKWNNGDQKWAMVLQWFSIGVSFKEIDHCRRQNWSRLRHLLKNHDASRIERSAHDCCNRPLNCGFVISFERREEKTVPWVNRTSLTRRMSPSKSWVGRNWALFVFVLANKVACLFSAVEEGLIMALLWMNGNDTSDLFVVMNRWIRFLFFLVVPTSFLFGSGYNSRAQPIFL